MATALPAPVEIQRLAVDAEGRLPDGRTICPKFPDGRLGCGDNAWATVANVVLAGAGTAFAFTATQPGSYRARMASEIDAQGRATAYGGQSPEVRVVA